MIALVLAAIPKPPFPMVYLAELILTALACVGFVLAMALSGPRGRIITLGSVALVCILIVLWAIVSHAATLSRCTW